MRATNKGRVLIVDDETMMRLHRRHVGVPNTTDVLTFPAEPATEAIDADIAVCVDVAARQAKRRGHRVEQSLHW